MVFLLTTQHIFYQGDVSIGHFFKEAKISVAPCYELISDQPYVSQDSASDSAAPRNAL